MQFKGLPKYNFRFKNAKKKLDSKPSASISRFERPFYKKKTPFLFLTKLFSLSFPFCKKVKSIICYEQCYAQIAFI